MAITTLTVLFKGVNQVTPAASAASASISGVGKSASVAGTLIKGALVVGALAGAKALFEMGAEAQRVGAQTAAGIASTGGAANVTQQQVEGLATSVQNFSGISDEAVQTGENMLLTFTNIRNEVGKGNDIFNQATMAISDMATKMNSGATPAAEQLQQTAIQVGKALNDPIKGLTALSKVGVAFTAQQKAQVAAMVAAGDTMGAQKLILSELAVEFGGSAKAMGSTFEGQAKIITNTLGNALEGIVVGLMKIATPIAAVVGWVIKLASASGFLVPIILGLAAGWAVYAISQAAAAAATAAMALAEAGMAAAAGTATAAQLALIAASEAAVASPLGPFLLAAAAAAVVLVGAFKLVQAGLSALSGGWSKMGGIMKVVLIATVPLWLPIVAAIKLVQGALKLVGAAFGFVGKLVGDFTNGISGLVKSFASGVRTVGNFVGAVTGLKILGEIHSANLVTAANDMNTFGASIALTAQKGTAGMKEMISQIQMLKATMPTADFAKQTQVGLEKLDASLQANRTSVADTEKGYMAWGLTLQEAQKRTAGITTALNTASAAMQQSSQISFKTADVMGSAWEKVGPKVAGSMKQIAKAIQSSLKATLNYEKNNAKVTARLINDYGLQADEAERSLAGTSAKAMATMAKASDKSFKQVGVAMQKANHIIPTVVKSQEAMAKSAAEGGKGAIELAKGTEATSKAADSAESKVKALGSATQATANQTQDAVRTISALSTELNGLPKQITIQVTVNVNKTGMALGGIVPGLARGGVSSMPLTQVGEFGREMAALPPGTRVYSHAETMGLSAAMRGGGGGGGGQPMTIKGRLQLVDGDAYIEGVVMDMLDDGSVVDDVLTKAMRRP